MDPKDLEVSATAAWCYSSVTRSPFLPHHYNGTNLTTNGYNLVIAKLYNRVMILHCIFNRVIVVLVFNKAKTLFVLAHSFLAPLSVPVSFRPKHKRHFIWNQSAHRRTLSAYTEKQLHSTEQSVAI